MIAARGAANPSAELTGETVGGETAARSLRLGLDGWKADVRERLAQGARTAEIARFFDLPPSETESRLTTPGGATYTLGGTGLRRAEADQGLDTAAPGGGRLAGDARAAGPIEL